jgi:hypothetical protein
MAIKSKQADNIDITDRPSREGVIVDITYQHKWHTYLFKNPAICIDGTWYVRLEDSYTVQGWRERNETG